jgi:2-polyprenyl-3-methyl-5-hydroxy-6-metoxy-1,4-benzoquinol methylase
MNHNPYSCSVCGSSNGLSVLEKARDYITAHIFDVIQCSSCNTRSTHPQPSNLDPYYPSLYRRYHKIVEGVLNFFYRKKAAKWSREFSQPGAVLEVGCGGGLMLKAFKEAGWEVEGIERTPEMSMQAEALLGQPIHACNLSDLQVGRKFELVVLFQVLEHIDDPLPLLRECASRLSENGKLIVAVPNQASWQARIFGAKWFHLDVPRHLFHYSPKSLENVFVLSGLKLDSLEYSSFEHDPYGWIQSALNVVYEKPNRLTRCLMRLDKPLFIKDGFMLLMAGFMAPLAIVLSLISWSVGSGAIMRATASKSSK